MSGTVDVAVKTGVSVQTGVGERVAVGDSVGNSDVDVDSGEGEISGVGVTPAAAVCVAPTIMVDMTAVPRKLRSSVGAGTLGIQAWVRSIKTDIRMKVVFLMGSPCGQQSQYKPKSAEKSAYVSDAGDRGFVPIGWLISISNPEACSWI